MPIKTVAEVVSGLVKFGNAPCMSFKTDFRTFRFTYNDLYCQVIEDINSLRKNKVKKGDRVILWAPNSPAWVSAFLATASIGAIVVPLDFRGTIDFAKLIVKEVKPSFAFIGEHMPTPLLSCPTQKVKPVWTVKGNPHLHVPLPKLNPSHVLEIVYTSGTTGKPKGVILTHQNVISNVLSATRLIMVSPHDSSVSLLPLSHMFEQVSNLFAPLIHGAHVVYLERLNKRMLFQSLEEEKPSFIPIVPRLLDLIKNNIEQEIREQGKQGLLSALSSAARQMPIGARRLLFPGLWNLFSPQRFRFFIAGGAPLDITTEQFFDDLGLTILQGYGLTESSPVLTMNAPLQRMIGMVGKPLPGVTIKIAQDGEILAKGPNITHGYYRNSKKTKELFLGTWLATGDVGSIDNNGFLHISGRKKDMIVTSEGMNVYPEDIEAILNRIKGVKDSAIVGYPKSPKEQVHAVLLLKSEAGSPRSIISEANANLPSYARIAGFTIWSRPDFPRTTTMKIKKFEVLKWLESQSLKEKGRCSGEVYATPLVHLVAQVTKKPIGSIKPHSNLTSDLGLSSLDRVELLSAIEDAYGLSLPDEVITPKTVVGDVERLVNLKKSVQPTLPFRGWVFSWPAGLIRVFIQNLIVFPFTLLFTRPVVEGYGNLRNLSGPFLIACNHTSHADSAVLLMSLPSRLRERVCPVALLEYFQAKEKNPVKQFVKQILFDVLYEACCLVGQIIPFPQTAGFGDSMRYAGKLVDHGYSILVFPEGQRTLDGKLQEFKEGIGVMAVHYKIPVIPVRVRGLFELLPRGSRWPKISPSSIHFGKPFVIKSEDYHEATAQIEKAIRGL